MLLYLLLALAGGDEEVGETALQEVDKDSEEDETGI